MKLFWLLLQQLLHRYLQHRWCLIEFCRIIVDYYLSPFLLPYWSQILVSRYCLLFVFSFFSYSPTATMVKLFWQFWNKLKNTFHLKIFTSSCIFKRFKKVAKEICLILGLLLSSLYYITTIYFQAPSKRCEWLTFTNLGCSGATVKFFWPTLFLTFFLLFSVFRNIKK